MIAFLVVLLCFFPVVSFGDGLKGLVLDIDVVTADLVDLSAFSGLVVRYEIRGPEQGNRISGNMEINATAQRVYGNRPIGDLVDKTHAICFGVSRYPTGLQGYVFREPCQQVDLSQVTGNSNYRTRRQLMLSETYTANWRSSFLQRLKNGARTDRAFQQREQELRSHLGRNDINALSAQDVIMLTRLIEVGNQTGARLDSTDYFELDDRLDQSIQKRLRQAILEDLDTTPDYLVAEDLIKAYQNLDLVDYSRGRPQFADSFFSALSWLHKIVHEYNRRDPVRDESTISLSFSRYCSKINDDTLAYRCMHEFAIASDTIFTHDRKNNLSLSTTRNYLASLKEVTDRVDCEDLHEWTSIRTFITEGYYFLCHGTQNCEGNRAVIIQCYNEIES